MAAFPQKNWTPVQPFPFSAARGMFTGLTSLEGLVSLRYYQKPDKTLAGVVSFGDLSQGAPGQVHGGMILTVLDEALGAAAWLAGHSVLTVRLETDFRITVPLRAELLVETKILKVRHRIVFVEGALVSSDGTRYAEAQGRFLELEAAAHERIFGRPR